MINVVTKIIISVVVLFSREESDLLFINGDICMISRWLKIKQSLILRLLLIVSILTGYYIFNLSIQLANKQQSDYDVDF